MLLEKEEVSQDVLVVTVTVDPTKTELMIEPAVVTLDHQGDSVVWSIVGLPEGAFPQLLFKGTGELGPFGSLKQEGAEVIGLDPQGAPPVLGADLFPYAFTIAGGPGGQLIGAGVVVDHSQTVFNMDPPPPWGR